MLILSIASGDATVVRQHRIVGAPNNRVEQQLLPTSPYWMQTAIIANEKGESKSIPLEDGWIEVEMPPHFMAGRFTEFSLRWVDFFR